MMTTTVIEQVAEIRAAATRWRTLLTVCAAIIFVAGLGISAWSLGLNWEELAFGPILLLLAVLSPMSLLAAGVSMQLTARAIDQRVGFRKACTISAIGRIAEILPLPGGAMVRGAALVRAGAGWGESAMIISLTAVLTLSMAAALAGVPLIMSGGNLGYIVFTAGAAGALMSAGWMIRRSGIGVTVAMLVSRIAIIALGVVHIDVAFNAIGVDVKIIDAALFVVASSLGGSLSIVPAGIGLSEAIAAALAMLVDIPSGAAFLAVAIVRMCSLAVNGLVATLAGIGERQLTEERRHVKD